MQDKGWFWERGCIPWFMRNGTPTPPEKVVTVTFLIRILKYSVGLYQVAANSTGAVGSLAYICQACASWNVSCNSICFFGMSISIYIWAHFIREQEIKSEGLRNEVCQILNGYKQVKLVQGCLCSYIFVVEKLTGLLCRQMLGNGGWEQCMSALDPAVVQRLARYGV